MLSSLLSAFILHISTQASAAPVFSDTFKSTAAVASQGHSARLQSSVHGSHDMVNVTINGTPLRLVVDTGSADTWAFHKDVICAEGQDTHVAVKQCGIGQVFPGDIIPMPGVHFQQSYGGGSVTYAGVFAFVEVKIADITLQKQRVAFVEHQKGNPLLDADGILGLAPK